MTEPADQKSSPTSNKNKKNVASTSPTRRSSRKRTPANQPEGDYSPPKSKKSKTTTSSPPDNTAEEDDNSWRIVSYKKNSKRNKMPEKRPLEAMTDIYGSPIAGTPAQLPSGSQPNEPLANTTPMSINSALLTPWVCPESNLRKPLLT